MFAIIVVVVIFQMNVSAQYVRLVGLFILNVHVAIWWNFNFSCRQKQCIEYCQKLNERNGKKVRWPQKKNKSNRKVSTPEWSETLFAWYDHVDLQTAAAHQLTTPQFDLLFNVSLFICRLVFGCWHIDARLLFHSFAMLVCKHTLHIARYSVEIVFLFDLPPFHFAMHFACIDETNWLEMKHAAYEIESVLLHSAGIFFCIISK